MCRATWAHDCLRARPCATAYDRATMRAGTAICEHARPAVPNSLSAPAPPLAHMSPRPATHVGRKTAAPPPARLPEPKTAPEGGERARPARARKPQRQARPLRASTAHARIFMQA